MKLESVPAAASLTVNRRHSSRNRNWRAKCDKPQTAPWLPEVGRGLTQFRGVRIWREPIPGQEVTIRRSVPSCRWTGWSTTNQGVRDNVSATSHVVSLLPVRPADLQARRSMGRRPAERSWSCDYERCRHQVKTDATGMPVNVHSIEDFMAVKRGICWRCLVRYVHLEPALLSEVQQQPGRDCTHCGHYAPERCRMLPATCAKTFDHP